MNKFIKALLISIPLLSTPTVWAYQSTIETGAGRGEWGNTERTYNVYTEARIGVSDNTYVYSRAEYNDHPVEDVKNEAYIGLGTTVNNFGAEIAGNDNRFYGSVYYHKVKNFYEVKGSVYHSNNYSQGFSRTGVKVQSGIRLNTALTTGVFYSSGHVTRSVVDDSYGLYLKLNF